MAKQIIQAALIIHILCLILSSFFFAFGLFMGGLVALGPPIDRDSLLLTGAYIGVFSPIIIFSLGALFFNRKVKRLKITESNRRLWVILFFFSGLLMFPFLKLLDSFGAFHVFSLIGYLLY